MTRNPIKAPNANNEVLGFSYKWTMWIETIANQRYECVWDLKKVQCYSLKPDGRRWLTLLPMRKEGLQLFYNKVVKKLYDFRKMPS